MQNRFLLKMAAKTDRELQQIVERKKLFQSEAVIAALDELEKRKVISDSQVLVKEEIVYQLNTEHIIRSKREKEDLGLISKSLIGALSFFFSPLIGTILLDVNLWKVGKRNEIWIVSALAIIYTFFGFMLVILFPLFILLINGLGAYILSGPLWDRLIETRQKPE